MTIRVKLFAMAKDIVGSDEIDVEVPDNGQVADLRIAVINAFPSLSAVIRHAMIAINTQYADDRAVLSADADVAVIPPVSGG